MKTLVSIIIVNFNGKKFLENLFLSIKKQTYQSVEIIFVDNNSTDGSVDYLNSKLLKKYSDLKPKTKTIMLPKNIGFAEANNIGAKEALGEFVLFLNNDTTIDTVAISEMVKILEKNFPCVGVSPKIYLSRFIPMKIFDSFGVCMDGTGSPYNRGIGLVDLGQYDKEEEIFGTCFACCLVRKELFLSSDGLDKDYFAYFEDVDWCFRMRKMGYSFLSCPKAIVYHYHSGTTSSRSYAWKYFLIFRNYLRTVVKDFGKKNAIRIVLIRIRSLFLGLFRQDYDVAMKIAMMKVLLNFFFFDIFIYIPKRLFVRSRFIDQIADENLLSFSQFEPSSFFNPVTYQPMISIESLRFSIYRQNYVKENKKMLKDWGELENSMYCHDHAEGWKKRLFVFMKKYFSKHSNEYIVQYMYDKLFLFKSLTKLP